MKSLIIGLGIGQLYHSILTEMGHDIVTLDTDYARKPDFLKLDDTLNQTYDTVHICTPNDTHDDIARKVAPHAKIVFIEKPGLKTADDWNKLLDQFPDTRFMMVKNNLYRTDFHKFKTLCDHSSSVAINWINNNRVPHPGSWFTDKDRAFGGVSRDLMPHLLSIMAGLTHYKDAKKLDRVDKQNWQLSDLMDSDYGTVDSNGVYNVDDYSYRFYECNGIKFHLTANWRSLEGDTIGISFEMPDGVVQAEKPLGLCPEDAYQNMIKTAIENIKCDTFWQEQRNIDTWIHEQVQ